MSEIIAKLGLNSARFEKGLDNASRNWTAFGQKLRAKPVEIMPAKSARESAGVFQQLLPPLPEVEKKSGGIINLLRRKFSTADLFKDSLRSLGVGLGVGAIANTITEQFSHAADRAKAFASHTADIYQNTLRLIGVVGGPRKEYELLHRQARDIGQELEIQRKLVAELNANPLNLVTASGRQMIQEAEQGVHDLIKRRAELQTQADAILIQENRRTEALQRQLHLDTEIANIELRYGGESQKFEARRLALLKEYEALKKQGALPGTLQENVNRKKALEKEREIFFRNQRNKEDDLKRERVLNDEMTKAELRDASDVEKKQIRLNALRREYDVLNERGATTPELDANRNQQNALTNEIKVDRAEAKKQMPQVLAGFASNLQTGRGSERSPRGRSERERLADRAARFQTNAEEGIRTGKSPDYVARMAKAARIDLDTVGGKVRESTSKVDPNDAKALSSELIKSRVVLEKIEKNLAPKAVK